MNGRKYPQGRALLVMLLALAIVSVSPTARGADPPVQVAVAVTGNPAPGATVTAAATITINDGSTLQSITWKQIGGVHVTLLNTTTSTVTVTLPDRKAYREDLIEILEEPPLAESQFPPNVPLPDPYEGGLQDRFVVVGSSPLSLEETGDIKLEITVVTSSGTYRFPTSIATTLPWVPATGLRNVPIRVPVLLHGKSQSSYNWSLTPPPGSSTVLTDATTQNPEFTPDVPGTYKVMVNDLQSNAPVTLNVIAGTWKGIITGQDSQGRPTVDSTCTSCHVQNTPHFDLFTPWKQSGHSEIFTQNVNNPAGHYSTACLSCHTVGYNTLASNNGFDDDPSFQAFLDSGLLTHGDPNNWTEILAQFPSIARRANIQCENCHGPQDSAAHMAKNGSRKTQSSEVCGTCHGEPARHGRYQQWQLSGHANYELAREEGTNSTCSKCHSSQGFIAWSEQGFGDAAVNVTWTTEDVHPQTCAACHDPHAVGTTSGGPTTNATVRVMGDTPMLMSGYSAKDVGRAAICMTCHNGRRGLRDDDHFNRADASRAPHSGPQADVLLGRNLYFAKVGEPGYHGKIEDSCVTCHMESTPPPPDLSYNLGGTNHTFYASKEICSKCHTKITAESVQGAVQAKMSSLKSQIELALLNAMQLQIRRGNSIDLGGTAISSASEIAEVELTESHGRQAVTVSLANTSEIEDVPLNSVKVVSPLGGSVQLYDVADPKIAKAAWNYFTVSSDASMGVHNPAFVNSALDLALVSVTTINDTPLDPTIGGGPGDGAGAVSCATPYVYWVEIAAHLPGAAASQWRTDLVTRNLSAAEAGLRFVLHQNTGNLEGTGAIAGRSQKVFEDLIGTLGGTNNKGSLEVCSDQPLMVMARLFNLASNGTVGQGLEGHVANSGYAAGQSVSLIGMRQKTGAFRSNLTVTNSGTTEAEVLVTLYDSGGHSLNAYNLTVPAGLVLQDNEPFKNRANAPDVDWGFATVTVLRGSNIQTSASLIDMKTNDPTTIPPKM